METLTNNYAEAEDTLYGKFLTFAVGDEVYGIEIRYVTEIVRMQPVIAMPQTPDYLKGIVNLRGKIIPVMDMRARFKKGDMAYNDRTCIVVIKMQDITVTVGMIVDYVSEVITISDENTVTPPKDIQQRYVRAIGKAQQGVVLLLDCVSVFTENGSVCIDLPN